MYASKVLGIFIVGLLVKLSRDYGKISKDRLFNHKYLCGTEFFLPFPEVTLGKLLHTII